MAMLVTGGAGYIGSVTVEFLIASGEETVVVDDLSTGHRGAISRQAVFHQGSVLDTAFLKKVFSTHRIDTVLHFAALSIIGESCTNPAKYFQNNVAGSLTLLDAMRDAGVGRFILSSTAAVYGRPDGVPITEEAALRPLNPYGLSKWMVEQMLECYSAAYGLRYVSLRYFNAAGATTTHGEDHEPETHLIPNVLMAAGGARPWVEVFGADYATPDGTCIRDYIHVEDLADAHIKAMEYLRRGGASEIANLGASVGTSVLQTIESVRRVTGKELHVRAIQRRPGDADRLVASSDKARRLLGWRPAKSDIETIVRDAWSWRQSHPHGYA